METLANVKMPVRLHLRVLACALCLFLLTVVGPQAIAETSLWKVKGERNTVYLLGSVHVLRPSDYPLPTAMQAAYEGASTLVLEVSAPDMGSPETQQALQLGRFQDGRTLQSVLKPETYAYLRGKARDAGLEAAALESFKPWMAAMLIMAHQVPAAEFEVTDGVDKHFETRALAEGKTIEALETSQFQMELFDDISTRHSDALLRQLLDDSAQATPLLPEMIAAWRGGNAQRLHQILTQGFQPYPEIRGPLITERNQQWANRLSTDYLKRSENVLVVIGAGHLVGPGSVVELLQKRGSVIEQL